MRRIKGIPRLPGLPISSARKRQRHLFRLILAAAALVALLTAKPFAGGWNDSSRLATVESLVDRGTFRIDESIYVDTSRAALPPFKPGVEFFAVSGTKDKMLIDGHFYSDKSPVPAVLMAGAYLPLKWLGLEASERPDWFALVMTWLFAGVPYVFAVWCIARTARHLGVGPPWKLLLTASFAFGSLATCYVQHVNNHILLMGVAAGVCEALTRQVRIRGGVTDAGVLPQTPPPSPLPETGRGGWRIVWIGTLAGFAYTIDLGAGPLLTLCVGVMLFWERRPSFALQALVFVLAAAPWIITHHALNYAISGAIGPGNAKPEYFRWPGSPFHAGNMTGGWNHPSSTSAGIYTLDLLWGKKGFLLFTLPLVQAVFGAYWLIRERYPERPVVIAFGAWALGTWLLYAATSRNLSGTCQSIRWFVPLLVPGYLALLVLVRDFPIMRKPLLILILGAGILNLELILRGPWSGGVPKLFWPTIALTLTVWISMWVWEVRKRRRGQAEA